MKLFSRFLWAAAGVAVLASCSKNSDNHPPIVCPPVSVAQSGIYALMGGNGYAGENGALYHFGWGIAAVTAFVDVYAGANDGRAPGALLEDMAVSNGRIYLLSQMGTQNGGDGQLVQIDGQSFLCRSVIPNLGFADGAFPQHLVVYDNKAFIQYAANMETESGIRVFDLTTGRLADADIAGTFGEFGTMGATKCRMELVDSKIFAPCGSRIQIIDAVSATVKKTVDFPGRQVKDIIKAADGYLYAVVTGQYSITQEVVNNWLTDVATYTSPASVVRIDKEGTVGTEYPMNPSYEISALSYWPNVGLCAHPAKPMLFFFDEGYSQNLYKFDCATGQTTQHDLSPALGFDGLSVYMAVDPRTDNLIVPVTNGAFAILKTSTLDVVNYDPTVTAPVPFCAGLYYQHPEVIAE